MQLTKEEIRKIAKLARLRLTDAEVDKYMNQLGSILSYVEMLKEVDTSGVPATSQVTGLQNMTREDKVDHSLASAEDLLNISHLPIIDGQIRINKIM